MKKSVEEMIKGKDYLTSRYNNSLIPINRIATLYFGKRKTIFVNPGIEYCLVVMLNHKLANDDCERYVEPRLISLDDLKDSHFTELKERDYLEEHTRIITTDYAREGETVEETEKRIKIRFTGLSYLIYKAQEEYYREHAVNIDELELFEFSF